MTLRKSGKLLQIFCDQCGFGYRERFHASEIRGNVARAKEEGWQVVRDGKQWRHYCPDDGGRKRPVVRAPKPNGGSGKKPKRELVSDVAKPTRRQWWQRD